MLFKKSLRVFKFFIKRYFSQNLLLFQRPIHKIPDGLRTLPVSNPPPPPYSAVLIEQHLGYLPCRCTHASALHEPPSEPHPPASCPTKVFGEEIRVRHHRTQSSTRSPLEHRHIGRTFEELVEYRNSWRSLRLPWVARRRALGCCCCCAVCIILSIKVQHLVLQI